MPARPHDFGSGQTQIRQIRAEPRVINSKPAMAITESQTEHVSEIEAALLDAELFMKYQAPDRAIKRLKTALELNGRSIKLRERLREVCSSQKHGEEAA